MILFILLKAFKLGYIDRVQLLTQNQIMCIQETECVSVCKGEGGVACLDSCHICAVNNSYFRER